MVEHRLAKARVASSNLVSRSNLRNEGGTIRPKRRQKGKAGSDFFLLLLLLSFILPPFSFMLTDGGVAKW